MHWKLIPQDNRKKRREKTTVASLSVFPFSSHLLLCSGFCQTQKFQMCQLHFVAFKHHVLKDDKSFGRVDKVVKQTTVRDSGVSGEVQVNFGTLNKTLKSQNKQMSPMKLCSYLCVCRSSTTVWPGWGCGWWLSLPTWGRPCRRVRERGLAGLVRGESEQRRRQLKCCWPDCWCRRGWTCGAFTCC